MANLLLGSKGLKLNSKGQGGPKEHTAPGARHFTVPEHQDCEQDLFQQVNEEKARGKHVDALYPFSFVQLLIEGLERGCEMDET